MLDLLVDPVARAALPSARRSQLRRKVARMVRAASLSEGGEDLEVALRLTDDAGIHVLNRDYRKKDRPTDVLAFALREGEGAELAGAALGDIVISVETARRQAKRGLDRELLFLAAHGLCHLLGYDHQTDAEEAAMNLRARKLLAEAARTTRVRAA